NAVNIDIIYPVGMVIRFAQNQKPNILFSGIKLSYTGENKIIRLASNSGNNALSSGAVTALH
ncbi:phage tail protein, partial [Morganella morganii subsp. sibonii]